MSELLKLEKGIIFVVSGPSGVGKTTVCSKLVQECVNVTHSISTTTRKPRDGEEDGKEYKFIDKEKFREKIKRSEFAEWAKVLDNYYGTEYQLLEENIKKGKDIILSIDVQGAASIKKYYPESVLIFLLPPSMKELAVRLGERGSENEKEVKKRLELANKEIEELGNYDYVLVNEKIDTAVDNIRSIITAERYVLNRYEVSKIIKEVKQ